MSVAFSLRRTSLWESRNSWIWAGVKVMSSFPQNGGALSNLPRKTGRF